MVRNPLIEKLRTNKVALGGRVNSPDMVELCAHLKLDWFSIDHMFTYTDWGATKDLIRAGEASGITPVLRVQANPWLGYDHRVGIEVTRAFGIGCQFVMVSHSCNKEIEEALAASEGWHRNATIVHQFKNEQEWESKAREIADGNFVIPHAESKGAFDQIEATLELPGIKLFFLAMTDASKVLTGSEKPDWFSPELWKFVDKAVKLGEKNGVMIGANSGYAYTLKEMRQRVNKMYDAGIKFISMQSAPFLFQIAMGEFLEQLNQDLR